MRNMSPMHIALAVLVLQLQHTGENPSASMCIVLTALHCGHPFGCSQNGLALVFVFTLVMEKMPVHCTDYITLRSLVGEY